MDDAVLEKAFRPTGGQEKTALVRMGVRSLIARESARRLSQLGGGSEPLLQLSMFTQRSQKPSRTKERLRRRMDWRVERLRRKPNNPFPAHR